MREPIADEALKIGLRECLAWLADELNSISDSATALQTTIDALTCDKPLDVGVASDLQSLDLLTQKAENLSAFAGRLSQDTTDHSLNIQQSALEALSLRDVRSALLNAGTSNNVLSEPNNLPITSGDVDLF